MSSWCRKNNWPLHHETLLNQIINLELTASHIYTALAAHFLSDRHYWAGLAKFFKESSINKKDVGDRCIRYQIIRGGNVEIEQIDKPIFDFSSTEHSILLQAITYTLELSQSIYCSCTAAIRSILIDNTDGAVGKVCDDYFAEFLRGHQQDRLEVMYDLGCMLSQIAEIGNDGFGLWAFDQKYL